MPFSRSTYAIGAVTPWVRAGVGAVGDTSDGGLSRATASGRCRRSPPTLGPAEALDQALAADPEPELRQLGAVTADGRAAAYTGAQCVEWAGHLVEDRFAVQGNMLANADVLPAMRLAFLDTEGQLA